MTDRPMDDLMQEPVVYLDEGLGAFYWPQQYKKDVGFTALYTADQMREYAKKAVEADRIERVVCCPECGCHFSGSLDDYYRVVPPLD